MFGRLSQTVNGVRKHSVNIKYLIRLLEWASNCLETFPLMEEKTENNVKTDNE